MPGGRNSCAPQGVDHLAPGAVGARPRQGGEQRLTGRGGAGLAERANRTAAQTRVGIVERDPAQQADALGLRIGAQRVDDARFHRQPVTLECRKETRQRVRRADRTERGGGRAAYLVPFLARQGVVEHGERASVADASQRLVNRTTHTGCTLGAREGGEQRLDRARLAPHAHRYRRLHAILRIVALKRAQQRFEGNGVVFPAVRVRWLRRR